MPIAGYVLDDPCSPPPSLARLCSKMSLFSAFIKFITSLLCGTSDSEDLEAGRHHSYHYQAPRERRPYNYVPQPQPQKVPSPDQYQYTPTPSRDRRPYSHVYEVHPAPSPDQYHYTPAPSRDRRPYSHVYVPQPPPSLSMNPGLERRPLRWTGPSRSVVQVAAVCLRRG